MIEFDRNQLIRAYMEQDGLNHEEAVKEVDKYLDYMKKQEELSATVKSHLPAIINKI